MLGRLCLVPKHKKRDDEDVTAAWEVAPEWFELQRSSPAKKPLVHDAREALEEASIKHKRESVDDDQRSKGLMLFKSLPVELLGPRRSLAPDRLQS